ncbi:cyclic AMP-dependent transcription factor ATF-2 isoform X1 [Harpegnathos saltator]|uniref:cyclic AMP-dependent transcription factor ATF-2 isoform X1 n=2 Tax=Harpegnathos saltator TaxID=610380 RepID=UPI00058F3F5B|nr:cyclic AMP-dependent transcription factor ATF-2 isoform X1 [Harpegnathos saltator]
MTDCEKPFACSTSGCSMSFTNEDQLSVHKKKHDMMLNLNNNSKNTGFVADQTPTPTRFIRNCEEVGLFQDLQVNPFEETFRRAVEEGNTGTLTVPEAGITDDTLHTPHIFPYIPGVLSTSNQILEDNVEECPPSVSLTEKSTEDDGASVIEPEVCGAMKLSVSDTPELMKDVPTTSGKNDALSPDMIVAATNAPIAPKLLPRSPTPHLSINGEEVQLLLKTADGKLMQLSATPVEVINSVSTHVGSKQQQQQQQQQQTVVIRTEPALRCASRSEPKKPVVSRMSLAKMKLKQALSKNAALQTPRPAEGCAKSIAEHTTTAGAKDSAKKTADQLKKKDILERNRASSMRARARRKAWIQQLERNVTNVNEANAALQMEVKALRAEVAKLKTLLLAHRDCPVTKAMQKGNGIVLGPKIISMNPEILTVPVAANVAKRLAPYACPESAGLPKKPSLSITKNPVIFPKVDCGGANLAIPNATIIKGLPTLKIVGVNQFLPEKEDAPKQQQILIVQNQPRKLCEAAARQIIQINPNYEVEHAASKSTGT